VQLLRRFRRGELRLARIEAFSDGVFAIVVTLLVLELKVPALRDAGSAGELSHQLRELLPKLLSWLMAFFIFISVALRSFADASGATDWGAIFAMSALSLVPALVVFVVFQRYLGQGISTTGMKG